MTAIKTNGIGQHTTSHLNLTRTMADVWRDEELRSERKQRWCNPRRPGTPRELVSDAKTSFAGKEHA